MLGLELGSFVGTKCELIMIGFGTIGHVCMHGLQTHALHTLAPVRPYPLFGTCAPNLVVNGARAHGARAQRLNPLPHSDPYLKS